MTVEERLRQAIEARTSTVEPRLDQGLDRITAKLDQVGRTGRTGQPGRPRRTRGPGSPFRSPWLLAAAAIVLVAAVVGGLVLSDGRDTDRIDTIDEPGEPDSETTTTEGTTSTTAESTSSTTSTTEGMTTTSTPQAGATPEDVLAQAVWPRPSSEVRFDDPVAAASSFARYLVLFSDPVVGEFRAGDSRSGEVPVRPTATGPETTVLVRQLSDDHWYVIGASTGDITVDQPQAGTTLASPQPLSGVALAFEGTVQVELRAYLSDGRSQTLAQTFVTGGGGPAAPFTGSLDWQPGSAAVEPVGVLIFSAEGGEDGSPWQATVVPVRIRP